jgi:hypothetical protein
MAADHELTMRPLGLTILAAPFAAAMAFGQEIKPPTEPWQALDPTFGSGAASCYSDEEIGNFWCFAVRCGEVQRLEFVHVFAGGDPAPVGSLIVDGREFPLVFEVVAQFEEHAMPLRPGGALIEALKGGERAEYVSAEQLRFPIDLTSAAAGIAAAESACQ